MGCILQRNLVLIQPLNKSGFCRDISVNLDPLSWFPLILRLCMSPSVTLTWVGADMSIHGDKGIEVQGRCFWEWIRSFLNKMTAF